MKKYEVLNPVISLVEEEEIEYNEKKDFTTLQCWQCAKETKLFFYKKIIPVLPKEENFSLKFQIRKAAVSATANIAEGYGRFYYQEGIQFYRISRGSIYELKDHLITCFDLNYIDMKLYDEGLMLIETTKKILNGYIKFVKNQKKNSENK